MSNPEDIISRLKSQILSKKKAYDEMKQKYKEILSRPAPRAVSHSPSPPSKSQLESLNKQIANYATEERLLASKLNSTSADQELELTEKIRAQEEKLSALTKLNQRLNQPKSSINSLTQKTSENEESSYREIKHYQKNILSLEKKIDQINEFTRLGQEKMVKLEKEFESLREASSKFKGNETRLNKDGLEKKLAFILKIWKSNTMKLENVVKEKEAELKALEESRTQLNSKVFKQDQQMRLLEMSKDDYIKMKKEGLYVSDTPDIYHPDVAFLYKPSVKALYST